MYKELLDVLICPTCKSAFTLTPLETEKDEIIKGVLTCEYGHQYYIHQGVVDFGVHEQEDANTWSTFYEETGFEEYDKIIVALKTDTDKKIEKDILESMVSKLSANMTVVDIASGRGTLLHEIANTTINNINLIATDLSFEVLMYDRIKLKKVNPNFHINYIACDATNLPLKPQCADRVVSYFGVANMMGGVQDGICESYRILKHEGMFLDAWLMIEENSKGYASMRQVCEENNVAGAETVYIKNNIIDLHKRLYSNVECKILYEGIKEEDNQLDLLPYPKEWYAEGILECKK